MNIVAAQHRADADGCRAATWGGRSGKRDAAIKERGGWQRSTLTRSRLRTTIDAGGLYFRVRDGSGCLPTALATNSSFLTSLLPLPSSRFLPLLSSP